MNHKVGGGKVKKNVKRTAQNHPMLQGFIKFDEDVPAGTTVWLSLWKNDDVGDGTDPNFGVAAQVSDAQSPREQAYVPQRQNYQPQRQQTRAPAPKPGMPTQFHDDEIPF